MRDSPIGRVTAPDVLDITVCTWLQSVIFFDQEEEKILITFSSHISKKSTGRKWRGILSHLTKKSHSQCPIAISLPFHTSWDVAWGSQKDSIPNWKKKITLRNHMHVILRMSGNLFRRTSKMWEDEGAQKGGRRGWDEENRWEKWILREDQGALKGGRRRRKSVGRGDARRWRCYERDDEMKETGGKGIQLARRWCSESEKDGRGDEENRWPPPVEWNSWSRFVISVCRWTYDIAGAVHLSASPRYLNGFHFYMNS